MDAVHFVQMARYVMQHRGDEPTRSYNGRYKDAVVEISDPRFINGHLDLEIVRRKAPADLEYHEYCNGSLDGPNPVTMVVSREDGADDIIRHHGEHYKLVDHMMWLLQDVADDEVAQFLLDMYHQYPKHSPKEGLTIQTCEKCENA